MAIGALGGPMTPLDTRSILDLRAQILARNSALSARLQPEAPKPSFDTAMTDALKAVNDAQGAAGAMSDAYERGDTTDIASVMLARQKAAISFEATLQVRNKLLSAYKDIMAMPV